MSIGKRLKQVRIGSGLTQKELADAIGCSVGTISRVESNSKTTLSDLYIHKAANALNCREMWLLNGEGAMSSPSQQNVVVKHERVKFRSLTLNNVSNALDDGLSVSKESDSCYEFDSYSDQAYVLVVPAGIGGSFFQENSAIIVDPLDEPISGSYVVVLLANQNDATIRQIIVDGDKRYLCSLIPDLPIIELSNESKICGVIKEMIIKF